MDTVTVEAFAVSSYARPQVFAMLPEGVGELSCQVHLPLLGSLFAPCRNPRERAAGFLRSSGTTMYVTRGVGEGMPIRFRSPREMPLITLRRENGP